jgi:hypothetical protein
VLSQHPLRDHRFALRRARRVLRQRMGSFRLWHRARARSAASSGRRLRQLLCSRSAVTCTAHVRATIVAQASEAPMTPFPVGRGGSVRGQTADVVHAAGFARLHRWSSWRRPGSSRVLSGPAVEGSACVSSARIAQILLRRLPASRTSSWSGPDNDLDSSPTVVGPLAPTPSPPPSSTRRPSAIFIAQLAGSTRCDQRPAATVPRVVRHPRSGRPQHHPSLVTTVRSPEREPERPFLDACAGRRSPR